MPFLVYSGGFKSHSPHPELRGCVIQLSDLRANLNADSRCRYVRALRSRQLLKHRNKTSHLNSNFGVHAHCTLLEIQKTFRTFYIEREGGEGER